LTFDRCESRYSAFLSTGRQYSAADAKPVAAVCEATDAAADGDAPTATADVAATAAEASRLRIGTGRNARNAQELARKQTSPYLSFAIIV